MGTVIEFPRVRAAQATSIDLDELCRFGEVVLFTGVRYSTNLPQSREAVSNEDLTGCGEDQDATA
jgi:hypothetical protein